MITHEEDDPNEKRELPEDCVYEILTRVAVSALPSCLRVCRSWRRLAHEPLFDSVHSRRTSTMPGFLLFVLGHSDFYYTFISIYDPQCPISVDSLLPCEPQNLFVEGTSPANGLLLAAEQNTDYNNRGLTNYYVTHFGTCYHRRIPNPTVLDFSNCSTAMFRVDNRFADGGHVDHFKIVRIYELGSDKLSRCICEIFDSAIGKWRNSCSVPCLTIFRRKGIVINQTAYWFVRESAPKNIPSSSPIKILAFDADRERCRVVHGPSMATSATGWMWKWELVACQDKLCLVHLSEDEVKVWTMAEVLGEFSGWDWRGLISTQQLKDHNFAYEQGIADHQVVLLETIYRQLWYEIKGREYVDSMNPPLFVWRLHMDTNPPVKL